MASLNILYSNINSYVGKKRLINHFIQKNDVSCAMFVETKTSPDSEVRYQGWNTVHQPGNVLNTNLRGGCLIQLNPRYKLIKENPPVINNPSNNCMHVAIPFKNDRLHIFLVYIHPNSLIEETIFTKAALYKYCIVVGDFNVNNQQKKRQMNRFLSSTSFEQHKTDPTFIMPNNNDTTPDLILYTGNLKYNIKKVELVPDLGADHLGFQINFNMNMASPPVQNSTIKYKFHKSNMERINHNIQRYIEKNQTIDQKHIGDFNTAVSKAILENTPTAEVKQYKYELPPFIVHQIKYKRRLYREYQNSKDPEIKKHINNIGKNINNMVRQYNNHKWVEACKEIEKSCGRKFYETSNKMTTYRKNPQLEISLKVTGSY